MAPSTKCDEAGDDGGARRRLETFGVVLAWFVLNIAMGSSTKWIFVYGVICSVEVSPGEGHSCHTYKFPLTITVLHMICSWIVCHVHIFYMTRTLKPPNFPLSWQLQKIAPLAGCFALSVAMGNLSLKYIYPSFNQMLGAMSPLITVLMAIILEGKRYNTWTWISMPIICGGLLICSAKEGNFHALGACFAIGATVLRSVKSLMQARLLTEKMDSVTLLYYMAPWAALVLFIMALFSEGLEPLEMLNPEIDLTTNRIGKTGIGHVVLLLVVSGLNACLLNVANFLVTSYTSAVMLQVLGNVKSCLSIGISVAIFKNSLNLAQAAGVIACLFGVWLYNQRGGVVKVPEPASHEKATAEQELPNISGTPKHGSHSGP